LDETKATILSPYFAGKLPPDIPDGEERLMKWLTTNMPKEQIWVYANNNFF